MRLRTKNSVPFKLVADFVFCRLRVFLCVSNRKVFFVWYMNLMQSTKPFTPSPWKLHQQKCKQKHLQKVDISYMFKAPCYLPRQKCFRFQSPKKTSGEKNIVSKTTLKGALGRMDAGGLNEAILSFTEWYQQTFENGCLDAKKRDTLPETNSSPLKISLPNRKIVFQPPFFGGYVKLRGCKLPRIRSPNPKENSSRLMLQVRRNTIMELPKKKTSCWDRVWMISWGGYKNSHELLKEWVLYVLVRFLCYILLVIAGTILNKVSGTVMNVIVICFFLTHLFDYWMGIDEAEEFAVGERVSLEKG